MRHHLKPAVVVISGLALAGCAASPPPPVAWSRPVAQPRSAPPPGNPWAGFWAPRQMPVPHDGGPSWGHDLMVAGAGVVGVDAARRGLAAMKARAAAADGEAEAGAGRAVAEPVVAGAERAAEARAAEAAAAERAAAARAAGAVGAESAVVARGAATAVTAGEAAAAGRVLLLDEFLECLPFFLLM